MSTEATTTQVPERKSVLQRLWERRFFQYVASYLIGSWALIQFVDWVVTRYHIAPLWTEILLLFLLAMIPSVLLFTYYHGKPGPDAWQKVEKIVIPVNFLLAIGLLFLGYSGKSLGTTQQVVEVTNEEGQVEERVVPKSAFSQRIVFLPLQNSTGSEQADWMRFALPAMQGSDLEQDYRIHAISPFELLYEYGSFGHSINDEIPFATQRKIAEDNYSDFFVTGEILEATPFIRVNLTAYRTTTGKAIYENVYSEDNISKIADAFTRDFFGHLYTQDALYEDETIVDLPAGNLYSYSEESMRKYVEGALLAEQNRIDETIALYEEIARRDPEFIRIYNELGILYLMTNQIARKDSVISIAMQRMGALPEREQMYIKLTHFQPQELVRMQALLRMWMDLYPSDFKPYQIAINFNRRTENLKDAYTYAKLAYHRGHTGKLLVTLAEICVDLGKTEEAKQYLEEFARDYPHKSKDNFTLGNIYLEEQEFEQARQFFDDLAIMNPGRHSILVKQAEVAGKQQRWDEGMQLLSEALAAAKQTADTLFVYEKMEGALLNLGQVHESIALQEKRLALKAQITPPFQSYVELLWYPTVLRYYLIDSVAAIETRIDSFMAAHPELEGARCGLDLNFYMAVQDQGGLAQCLADCEEQLLSMAGASAVLVAKGLEAQFDGRYAEAAEHLLALGDETGLPAERLAFYLGLNLRKSGQLAEARKVVQKALDRDPSSSFLMLEMAHVEAASNNNKAAQTVLDELLEVWKDADPSFKLLQDANALRASL